MNGKAIIDVLETGMELSYKLLHIGKFKFWGVEYIQVHCDRADLEYSHMFELDRKATAVSKFLELKVKYGISEQKYGKYFYCPPKP